MPKTASSFEQANHYLNGLVHNPKNDYLQATVSRDIFLKRFLYFLKLLDNPQKKLKFIHATGTSGKGSVCTMIYNGLLKNQVKAGLYLSPHCQSVTERIFANGKEISKSEFVKLFKVLLPAIETCSKISPFGQPSYFEVLTAMAFLHFKNKGCKLSVLEVGLGGTFDATNVIARAEVSVITKIGHDHTAVLGKTLIQIATEKSNIIKKGSICVSSDTNQSKVKDVIKSKCNKLKVPCIFVKSTENLPLEMQGEHQQENAALALAALQKLGYDNEKSKQGVCETKLPCRFEIMQQKPLVVLDGAHNKSKIDSVVKNLHNLTFKRLYIIMALTHSRNPKQVFKNLLRGSHQIITTTCHGTDRKFYSAVDLKKKIGKNKALAIENPSKALQSALDKADKNDMILVVGSLYLCGMLRSYWVKK